MAQQDPLPVTTVRDHNGPQAPKLVSLRIAAQNGLCRLEENPGSHGIIYFTASFYNRDHYDTWYKMYQNRLRVLMAPGRVPSVPLVQAVGGYTTAGHRRE